jgi:hypothetical protein
VVKTGLIRATEYTIEIVFMRRLFNEGSYELYLTQPYSATADDSGQITITDEIPIERGYETFAYSCAITAA